MDTRSFRIELKELDEASGEFTGIASVYGVEDLGADVIERGAFKKTIAENPSVPILWQHDSSEVIGRGEVKEEGDRVMLRGKLDLEDPTAQKAFRKLKAGLISGLSIGYQAVKVTWEETKDRFIRHVNELKLWEVSVVTFPMLPEAQVTAVKDMDSEERALLQVLRESKAGRKISAASRARIESAISELQALLTDEDATSSDDEAGAKSGAAAPPPEPAGGHSAVSSRIEEIRALLN